MASIILSELLDKIMKIDSNDNNSISKNRDAYNLYLEAINLWNERQSMPNGKRTRMERIVHRQSQYKSNRIPKCQTLPT